MHYFNVNDLTLKMSPLGLSKRQSMSPQTVLLGTTLTRMIIIHVVYLLHYFSLFDKVVLVL